MKTIHDNSCKCQAIKEESDSTDKESRRSCRHDEQNVCSKLSDPAWIRANIEYFPAGFAASDGICKNISLEEMYQMFRQKSDKSSYIILDVKTEQEYRQRHLPHSMNLDFFSSTFKDDLFCLNKDNCYFVICKIGVRSGIAMNVMKKMGFTEVYNVIGGDDRWIAEEIPFGHEDIWGADGSSCISA